jgi:hypothetical protein
VQLEASADTSSTVPVDGGVLDSRGESPLALDSGTGPADATVDGPTGRMEAGAGDSCTGCDGGTGCDGASCEPIEAGTEAGVDAGMEASVDAGTDAGSDTGTDSGTDAQPAILFGPTCTGGTVYTDPFTTNPVTGGTWTFLVGPWTYNGPGSVSLVAGKPNTQLWIGPRPAWTDYSISVPVRIDVGGGNGGINFRMQSTPASPANDSGKMYYAGIDTTQVILGKESSGWTMFDMPPATFAPGTFYTLLVSAAGNQLSVSVDGVPYIKNYMDGSFTFGSIGLRSYNIGMTYGPVTVTCN